MARRPSNSTPVGRIIVGDARTELSRLPPAAVDTVITSPPYLRLRNYQTDGQFESAWV
jgi:site-specific DNA-methyltransferase (adenine-specific)